MKGKGWLWAGGVVLVLALGFWLWLGPVISAAVRAGFLDQAQERTLKAGQTEANLKALHQAIMMYSESEGALPEAAGWMDAAYTRLKTADLKDEEAKKQMKSQEGLADDQYGYAMNRALSGKDPFDPKLKDEPLIFESESKSWNAAGDPVKDRAKGRTAQSITLDGSLKPVKGP